MAACHPAARASYGRRMADVRLDGDHQDLGDDRRGRGRQLFGARRPSGGAARAFRLRQVDDLAADRRARDRERRHDQASRTATSPRCRPPSAASRWCSRTTRCFRISRSPRTSCSASRCATCRRPSATRGSRAPPASSGWRQLLDRKPSQLSGGQQQRVALGRAIVAETRVCLMDEPLSNLDAQLRVEMRREIRALAAPPRHDHAVRHPRPGRGDDDGGPGGADAQRPHRAGRRARRAVREARDDLRGALRRHAADERDPGRAAFRRSLARRARTAARATRSRSASGPRPRALGADGVPATVAAVEYLGADTLIDTRIGGPILHRARRPAARPRPSATMSASAGSRRPRTGSICRHNVASIDKTTSTNREDIMDRRTISRRHRGARRQRASQRPRSRRARPKSRSSIRSRSAARSPRSSTAMRPISRRPIRRSR